MDRATAYYLSSGGGSGPLPPSPGRDVVCGVNIGFQGITIQTSQFGAIPAFGPETTTLSDADLISYVEQMVALGKTHVEIAISWQYREVDFSYPVPGRDLTQDLPELNRRIRLMLGAGAKAVILFLAGDGRSAPKNPDGSYPYNDPQGWTYGYEWLMDNIGRIIEGVKELTPYILFCPGYDGVFYGWGDPPGQPDLQPTRIASFGQLFRQILPDGFLAIEHATGVIPVGGGVNDYNPGGKMQPYDVIMSEFNNWPITGDPTWQIAGRMLGPAFHRPADMPSGDDPNPPFYLAAGTPRGPYRTVAYEFATYPWVRGRISAADVEAGRLYYQQLGYTYTG